MYYLNYSDIWLEKKHSQTSLKFQLLNTHTYEEKAALLIFCCNGMGNVPPLERFIESSSTAFSIQETSGDFAVI